MSSQSVGTGGCGYIQSQDEHAQNDAVDASQRAASDGFANKAHEILLDARLRFPNCARIAYALGVSLLERRDMTGLDHLKFAMAQDETVTGAACAQAIQFLDALGEEEAAAGFRNKLAAWHGTTACAPTIRNGPALTAPKRVSKSKREHR